MHGNLFRLFDTSVPSYFALIVVGFVFATTMGALWARRVGQNPDVIVDLGLIALLAGFAGARLLHVFADGYFWDYVHLCTDPSQVDWHITRAECEGPSYAGQWDAQAGVCHPTERNCFAWAELSGGFTFFGGFIAASLASVWLFKRDRFPLWKALDMGGMMVPIGLGFGRLGCLLAGCCFGKIDSDLPWALSFPPGSPASDWQAREGHLTHHLLASLPVHPTQLYEAAAALLIAAVGILYVHGRKRYDGQVFVFFLVAYGVARFSVEWFRSDDRGGGLGLSTSQWISLGLLAVAAYLHVRRSRTGGKPPGMTAVVPQAGLVCAVLVALGILGAGCSAEQPERYPELDDRCSSEHCLTSPPSRGGGGGFVEDGGNGTGLPDGGMPITLSGTVSVVSDQALTERVALSDARVEITALIDNRSAVTTEPGPDGTFELEVPSLPARLIVEQLSGARELLTTSQWIDEVGEAALELTVVERVVLDDIALGLSVMPTALDDRAGHALLQFVDDRGLPVAGVRMAPETGSSAVIAYDLGEIYSDATEATDARGSVALLNVPAASLPGTPVEISVDFGGEVQRIGFDVARDSVSLLRVQLNP